ncbi:DUF6192 family protein [Streptomyces swartbergensis]|uniref:DUF6192 family protein n=1 Tax=Streptomyces swartbergensis TaxID=487165 RepID=UPI003CC55381
MVCTCGARCPGQGACAAARRRRRTRLGRGLSRVRAAADWIENAITRGEIDLDGKFQKLRKGSGE